MIRYCTKFVCLKLWGNVYKIIHRFTFDCLATRTALRERERERLSLSLCIPSCVSSVATSASSTALSHHAVGVSFVLPPQPLCSSQSLSLPSCSHDAPVMTRRQWWELVSLKEWLCLYNHFNPQGETTINKIKTKTRLQLLLESWEMCSVWVARTTL